MPYFFLIPDRARGRATSPISFFHQLVFEEHAKRTTSSDGTRGDENNALGLECLVPRELPDSRGQVSPILLNLVALPGLPLEPPPVITYPCTKTDRSLTDTPYACMHAMARAEIYHDFFELDIQNFEVCSCLKPPQSL